MIQHSRPWITEEDIIAVRDVMSTSMIAEGSKASEFEQALTTYIGAMGTVLCSSGTAGIIMALEALGVRVGDEVILPTYVCHSVADAICSLGGLPVFCDIGEYWNITPEIVERHLSKRTKAIIVVHTFGITMDVEDFKEYGIPVIEDCCQAFGAKFNGRQVGICGDVGVFSFHATKCLTTGEGGAVVTSRSDIYQKLCALKQTYRVRSPISDMQAALGLSQLKRYNEFLSKRRHMAQLYLEKMHGELTSTIGFLHNSSMFFRFPLRLQDESDFESIQKQFADQGILIKHGVDQLLHRCYGLADNNYRNAVKCFNQTLSVPIYPALEKKQCLKVVETVNNILGRKWGVKNENRNFRPNLGT